MSTGADPIVGRWLVVIVGAVLAHGVASSTPPPQRRTATEGAQLPRRGCLAGAEASERDFRTIPGVGKRLAGELVRHCRAAPCTPRQPAVGVRGVGPVLAGRLAAVFCDVTP